jgi:hypothetical protein
MTNSTGAAAPSELRRVITLLLVNLGLSALLALLFALFHNSLLDYQMSRLGLPPTADVAAVRAGLSAGLWSRAVVVIIVGVVTSSSSASCATAGGGRSSGSC